MYIYSEDINHKDILERTLTELENQTGKKVLLMGTPLDNEVFKKLKDKPDLRMSLNNLKYKNNKAVYKKSDKIIMVYTESSGAVSQVEKNISFSPDLFFSINTTSGVKKKSQTPARCVKSPSGDYLLEWFTHNGVDVVFIMFNNDNADGYNTILTYSLNSFAKKKYKIENLLSIPPPPSLNTANNVKLFMNNFQKITQKNLRSTVDLIKSRETELLKLCKEEIKFNNELSGMLGKIDSIADEINRCREIKGIVDAGIHDGFLYIFTENLNMSCETGEYELGRIQLKVNLNDGKVYVKNFDRTVKGMNDIMVGHPHVVESNGKLCLGEIRAYVPQLIGKFQFIPLCSLLLNFLMTANPSDSAGFYVKNFPVIGKKEVAKKDAEGQLIEL